MKKETKTTPAKNVDEYLKELPADVKSMLQKVRKAIKGAAPKAEEVISYGIPTYKYKGPLLHFAAFKDHCSFIVISRAVTEIFKDEFSAYKSSGRTIHFFPNNGPYQILPTISETMPPKSTSKLLSIQINMVIY